MNEPITNSYAVCRLYLYLCIRVKQHMNAASILEYESACPKYKNIVEKKTDCACPDGIP